MAGARGDSLGSLADYGAKEKTFADSSGVPLATLVVRTAALRSPEAVVGSTLTRNLVATEKG